MTLLMVFGFVFSFTLKADAATVKPKLNKTRLVLEMNTEDRLEIINCNSENDEGFATADDPNEVVVDTSIKWTSSNKKVVTVDAAGTLTPVSVGSANITAKADESIYGKDQGIYDFTIIDDRTSEWMNKIKKNIIGG